MGNKETAELFYFSGTGNSLHIAKTLAKGLNGKVRSIVSALEEKYFEIDSDIIGIIYPVYCLRAPKIVIDFAKKIKKKNKDAYVFIVANCGAIEGNALQDIDEIINPDIGFVLFMPDNSIAFPTHPDKHKPMLEKAEQGMKEILEIVSKRKKVDLPKRIKFFDIVGSCTMEYMKLNAKRQKASEKKCTHCRTCIQTCPVGNITLRNKKIIFGKDCQYCFGCIQVCPENAITFGLLKKKKKNAYTHPHIIPQEIGKIKKSSSK
jgi:ferredoxin